MKTMHCHHQAEVSELRNNPELAQAYLQEAMQWIDQPDGRAASLMVLRALAQSHVGMRLSVAPLDPQDSQPVSEAIET